MPGVLADVMNTSLPIVESDQPAQSVAEMFDALGCEHILVVSRGRLEGAIAASVCGRCVCRGGQRTAGQLAGRYVVTASEQTPIDRVFKAFGSGVDRIVVVLRNGVPVGLVRKTDLFGCARPERAADAVPRPHFLDREESRVENANTARPA